MRFSKSLLIVLLAAPFFLNANPSYAQARSIGAANASRASQQFAQNMQMQMTMNRNWRKTADQGDQYVVIFKDSSRKSITSYMYKDSISHKNFLVSVDKKFRKSDSVHRYQKIYPDQTLRIIAIAADGQGGDETKYGIPADSCWILKVVTGSITVYAKSGYYITAVTTSVFGNPMILFKPKSQVFS